MSDVIIGISVVYLTAHWDNLNTYILSVLVRVHINKIDVGASITTNTVHSLALITYLLGIGAGVRFFIRLFM